MGTLRSCHSNDHIRCTSWKGYTPPTLMVDILGDGLLGTERCYLPLMDWRCGHGRFNNHSCLWMLLRSCCFILFPTIQSCGARIQQRCQPHFRDHCSDWICILVDVLAIIQWCSCSRWSSTIKSFLQHQLSHSCWVYWSCLHSQMLLWQAWNDYYNECYSSRRCLYWNMLWPHHPSSWCHVGGLCCRYTICGRVRKN